MLKKKIGEFSRMLEAERNDKLAQSLIMAVVSDIGLENSIGSRNDHHITTHKSLSRRYP